MRGLSLTALTAAIICVTTSGQSVGQTWFTDVAPDYGVDAGTHSTYSCSWADWDNDGNEDLFITGYSPDPLFRLFTNNFPDPSFTYESDAFEMPDEVYVSTCAVWGDYDNDGDLDVYVCQGDYSQSEYPAPNILYRNEGGQFSIVTDAGVDNEGASKSAAWGDYDLDGDLDLYVVNKVDISHGYTHRNELYRNDGGTFEPVASIMGVDDYGDDVSPFGTAFVDFNDDGYPDIYVAKLSNEANRLYKSIQGEAFVDVASSAGVDALYDETWSLGAGDFDNDNDLDFYMPVLSNIEDPSFYNRLFEFDPRLEIYTDVASRWGVKGIFNASNTDSYFTDFDNDGDWDLHVLGFFGASYTDLLFQKGPVIYTDVTSESGLGDVDKWGVSVAWADFNRDGKEDCYVGNAWLTFEDRTNRLFINEFPEAGKYLHIRLIGAESSRDGTGAKVFVRLPDETRLRKDYGFTSGRSQSSLPVEFGCKNFSTVDSVLVYWPSGDTSVFEDVATNQRITIVEQGNFYNMELTWDSGIYGDFYISGDVGLSNTDLELVAGTKVYFHKEWGTGNPPKLTVGPSSTLYANGTVDKPVVFTSQHPVPAPGDWEGIQSYAYITSTWISMTHTHVSYANNGFHWVDAGTIRPDLLTFNNCRFTNLSESGIDITYPSIAQANITNCYFQSCGDYGIKVKKDISAGDPAMTIVADTILNCTNGIYYRGNSNQGFTKRPVISSCVIRSLGPPVTQTYGIFVTTYSVAGSLVSPLIEADSIVGFYCGINLSNVNSNCVLVANKVKANSQYGLYLKSASPNILPSLTNNPNVFNSSYIGIYCDKYSSPYVRWTKIKENRYRGVLVEATQPPDFGSARSYGYNSIHTGFSPFPYADMEYTQLLPPLNAIGNWWGEPIPDPSEIIGNISYIPALSSDPLPGYEKREDPSVDLPDNFGLRQNFPNPFNAATEIAFYLHDASFAELRIYSLNGQLVRVLLAEHLDPGEHSVVWDGKNSNSEDAASGIYFYVLSTDHDKAFRRMTLLR